MYKQKIMKLLQEAGIHVNGSQPYDIQIHDPRTYRRLFPHPILGIGEAYMEGWWSCEKLDEFIFRMLRNSNIHVLTENWYSQLIKMTNILFNQQTRSKSRDVAIKHYNLDNAFYRCMLGESMTYSCAYWHNATLLDEAQYQKLDLICRKLKLTRGNRILDIGCGWGAFAKYVSERYGCEVVAVNIAEKQVEYAHELCKGLPVTFYLCDWRDDNIYNPKNEKFDHVISVGFAEHLGYKNYRQFMQVVRANLKEDGLFLLHTIGRNDSSKLTDPWIRKYIFPHGMTPSLQQLAASMEQLFILEDLHNFGSDYDKTLMTWKNNFDHHWPQLSHRYDDKFYRMWSYYLLTCAGVFRARDLQLWQFVLSPRGVLNGYQSLRE